MVVLYLLRHAKSSWDDPALADRERPLSPRGREATRRLRAHLGKKRISPGLVLCSPSTRTRETLDGIRPALRKRTPVEFDDVLYGAGADELLRRLLRIPVDVPSAMAIGHNPGLEMLAELLAARGDPLPRLHQKFPTGGLATLVSDCAWSELRPGCAELADFVVPRELA